jgi:F420-dependent oxidoreductase-like protein
MELSVNVDLTEPLDRLRQYVREVESAGAAMLWVAEAAVMLGHCAAYTDRLRLGTAVMNVFSRTPAQLAQLAATVDELTDGRFELGLGSSGPQVVEGWHGVPFRTPLRRTAEVIDVCRAVWRREERVTYAGRTVTIPYVGEGSTGQGKPLKMIGTPVRPAIPVWIAALGPANVELAARVADGWMPMLFVPERYERVWGEALARGARERAPELGPLRISASAPIEVTEDNAAATREARDRTRPVLARYLGAMGSQTANFYNQLVRRYGFEAEAERVQTLYLDGRREAAEAALSEELVEALTVCGPPGYVRERLATYAEAGVTDFRIKVNAHFGGARDVERVRELMP